MRDTKVLYPELQIKIPLLIAECSKQGIDIGIGECHRTIAEQDALYTQGRTTGVKGKTVTNAKGSTYGSMHQWFLAFDFYLIEDVDGDGKTSDDAFNNKTSLFNKVGVIGRSLGLEWGGDWTSITDLPHFQIPDWGSAPTKLKKLYGTPDKFVASWRTPPVSTVTTTSSTIDIIWLQERLTKHLKGYTIKVTGIYDDATRIAVLLYWKQLGWGKTMKDDGTRAGRSTLNALASGRKE